LYLAIEPAHWAEGLIFLLHGTTVSGLPASCAHLQLFAEGFGEGSVHLSIQIFHRHYHHPKKWIRCGLAKENFSPHGCYSHGLEEKNKY